MKIHYKLLAVLISTICLNYSCQKEEYQSQIAIDCTINSDENPNNSDYLKILDFYSQNGIVGLSVVIEKNGQDTWFGSSGYSSVEENIKMNNCNIYQTASLAKSFIGVITLQLIDEGVLQIDDNINDYLTNDIIGLLPEYSDVTIKHLLQHTSGFPDIFGLSFISDFMNDPTKIYSREELLNYVKNQDLLNAPGDKHQYSDTNYILLSMIIDKLEGNHITAIQNRLITPLNLNSTYYHTDTYPDFDFLPQSYWDQYNNGEIENISLLQKRVSSYILGSDGIISSPADMLTFYTSVIEGNVLSENSKNLILNDYVSEEETFKMNTHYSHGFMIIKRENQTWIGHAGNQIGTSCFVFYNIDSKDCLGVFTNVGTFFFQEKQTLVFSSLWEELKSAI